MDNFKEQLVQRKRDARDLVIKILILFVGASLTAISIFFTVFFAQAWLILIGAGAVYLTWYVLGSLTVEYEYILTNNDLDIDKVVGRRKRKRLITIKLSSLEDMGVYSPDKEFTAATTVVADDGTYRGVWYIVAKHEAKGKTLLLFSPDSDLVYALTHSIPGSLRRKVKEAADAEFTASPEDDAPDAIYSEPKTVAEVIENAEKLSAEKPEQNEQNEPNELDEPNSDK